MSIVYVVVAKYVDNMDIYEIVMRKFTNDDVRKMKMGAFRKCVLE